MSLAPSPPAANLRAWLWVAAALALIALAWAPGFGAPYQYDDFVTPLKDPASQSLSSWAAALPQTLRPLTKLTYAVESSLGLTEAPARRALNAALFVLTAVLLGLLCRAAGLKPAPAAGLAALWAVHPVHAETVIALAGRSVLLSLCLTLASALLLLRQRPGFALACAILAVLARETAWAWLVACAALAAARSARGRARLLGTVALSLAAGGALVLASSRLRALLAFSFEDPHAFDRLGLQWAALPKGTLMLLLEPGAFSVDIDFAPRGAARAAYVLLAFAMYGSAAWIALGKERPLALRVAALLWLSLVVPLHSVIPKLDPLTARSFSASSAALALWLSAGAATFFSRRTSRAATYTAGAYFLLSLSLVSLTRERAALYQDPIALWQDAAARSSKSLRPLVNLGTLLAQKGQLSEARVVLERAVRRDPNSGEAREKLSAVVALIETRRLLTEPSSQGSAVEHEIDTP